MDYIDKKKVVEDIQKEIVTELRSGFEGYGPLQGKYELYGYISVEETFSWIYRLIGKESHTEATFCFFIDKEEAIYLEDIMLREKDSRSMRSETNCGGDIFMTSISGSNPIISIPKKGFSFRFFNGKDYDKLLNMLSSFLNKTSLDEKLQELRNMLEKERGGV